MSGPAPRLSPHGLRGGTGRRFLGQLPSSRARGVGNRRPPRVCRRSPSSAGSNWINRGSDSPVLRWHDGCEATAVPTSDLSPEGRLPLRAWGTANGALEQATDSPRPLAKTRRRVHVWVEHTKAPRRTDRRLRLGSPVTAPVRPLRHADGAVGGFRRSSGASQNGYAATTARRSPNSPRSTPDPSSCGGLRQMPGASRSDSRVRIGCTSVPGGIGPGR